MRARLYVNAILTVDLAAAEQFEVTKIGGPGVTFRVTRIRAMRHRDGREYDEPRFVLSGPRVLRSGDFGRDTSTTARGLRGIRACVPVAIADRLVSRLDRVLAGAA